MIEIELKEMIENRFGNVKAFSKEVNLPYTTVRSILQRGIMNSNVENVIQISTGLGFEPEDLIKLKRIDSVESADQGQLPSKILNLVSQLETNRQLRVHTFAENQLDEQNKVIQFPSRQDYVSEEIQAVLSAGTGIMNYYEADNEIVSVPTSAPEHDWIFKIRGDSMKPMFDDDDIVYVNEFDPDSEDIQNGRIYVVEVDSEAYIKKVYVHSDERLLRLVSLNSEYSDIVFNFEDSEINFIGRVII